MPLRLAKEWAALTRGKPGHRFRDRYRAQRRNSASGGLVRRIVHFVLAGIFVAIGLVLAVMPGPAILFFFLAGALLASDWLWMARFLDWLEVKLRAGGRRAARKWRRLPAMGRVALITLVGCVSVAATYGAYRLIQ